MGVQYVVVDFDEMETMESLTANQREEVKPLLLNSNLKLMENKRAMLIEKIKNTVVEMVHHTDELIKTIFLVFLSVKLNRDYTYLAHLFCQVQGTTFKNNTP